MKRIGKFFCTVSSLAILLTLFSTRAISQPAVSVEASVSETTIYKGERISLSIKINGDFSNVSRPRLPEFQGFRLLSNMPSTSRSYSFINGESSTEYTYSYYLIAQSEGSYQVPPITVAIDGEEYQTEPIDVKIVSQSTSAADENSRPEIFLQLQVSDEKPVTGQQVITDIVLFFKDGLEVNSYQPVPGWKAQGFWKENLENSSRPQASSTIIDGVRYRKARLLRFALFPTKTGPLEISPYKIIVAVRSARSRDSFSSFFGGFGTNQRQVEIESDPVTLQVQPLPSTEGSDYLGAVGNFDISRSISMKKAVAGESIEITTQIEGRGNIPLISKPQYDLPDGLEIYNPQESTNLNRNNGQISGSITFTDVIIARSPGSYSIPQKEVAYFSPSENQYITETLPALNFEVSRSPDVAANVESQGTPAVNPVTGLATWVSPQSNALTSYWWFWAGIAFPLIVLGVAYWQKTYSEKMATDHDFARSRQASGKAAERLEEAISLSEGGKIKEAYNMLQKALTGFISDRLSLSQAGLSNEDYIKALQQQEIDENLVKNVRMLLDKCASISYAPSTTHEYLKSHVGLAQSTLEKLKKVL